MLILSFKLKYLRLSSLAKDPYIFSPNKANFFPASLYYGPITVYLVFSINSNTFKRNINLNFYIII